MVAKALKGQRSWCGNGRSGNHNTFGNIRVATYASKRGSTQIRECNDITDAVKANIESH